MTDPDPHDEISRIEAQLERLTEIAERCRKIILLSKAAIGIGITVLLAMVFGIIASNELFIFSIVAVLGGIVLLGSNVSTLRQTVDAMAAAEAARSSLIDDIELRVVGDTARLG